MKKAVLYARVSSDLQKKEKTIDSQVIALKKQITEAGDTLVKEYIDDGFSGARLDRPAMNQLRDDIKTNSFDVIYFLNTDRIAREVTYQTIIIAEIIKYKKQIIINGKDYVNDPENKFTLTVLGAVAELERAKIIERVTRAKQYKIHQGSLSGNGCFVYGYDHHRRTPTSPPSYSINETEASIVRYIYETYAQGGVGMRQITRHLENIKAPTKKSRGIWRISLLKAMLQQEMYLGVRYYNTMRKEREYANPIHGIKYSTTKHIKRDRSEWVGVKVPAIISQELFDKVQARLEWNRKYYRNPRTPQLLSNLIRCGCCGSSFFSYRRYYRDTRGKIPKVHIRVSYKCNYKHHLITHHSSFKPNLKTCNNMEIKTQIIEDHVFSLIKQILIDPLKLKEHMIFFKRRTQANQIKIEKQINKTELLITKKIESKKRILELYTSGGIEKDKYISKNIDLDNELNHLKSDKESLTKQIPLLNKKEVIDMSINEYCETAKIKFNECNDFEAKRSFLLNHIEKIVYWNEKLELHGSVPIILNSHDGKVQKTELTKIQFCIKDKILMSERLGRKNRKPNFSIQTSRSDYDSLVNN